MQYYRTIDRIFATGPEPRLRIANRSGELTIIGEDRQDVAFTAQLAVTADSKQKGEEELDAIDLPISHDGDTVVIGAPESEEAETGVSLFRHSRWGFGLRIGMSRSDTRVDMVARVPRRCQVQASHRSGPVRISGIHAPVAVESRSGRTDVREIGGAVRIEGRSGAIELRDVTGNVTIVARSGRVEVEQVTGDLELRSRSGHVSVADVRGALTIHSRSGRVTLSAIRGETRVESNSGAVEWRGPVRAPLSIDAHTGLIRLAVEQGAGFYIDAETKHGSVRSELPVDHLDKPVADAPTVRLRAHTGAIRIVAA